MHRRHGIRLDVLAPLLIATAVLPLGLLIPVVHFSWALKADTTFSVLTGTFDLLRSGHVTIGLIILLFSVLFPSVKILALYGLWFLPLEERTTARALRWLEFLGKWSMLDVFVVGLLVWALDLGLLSETTPLPGAYVFTAAVLCSMAATLRQLRWARSSGTAPPAPSRPPGAVAAFAAMTLALIVAGVTLPLMRVDKWTFWTTEFSIAGGTAQMFRDGYFLMGALMAAFVIAAPVLHIASAAGLWAVGRSPAYRGRVAVGMRIAGRCAMTDVFVLGVAVVLSKIGGVVNVTPRPGLWFLAGGAVLGSCLGWFLSAPSADKGPAGRLSSSSRTASPGACESVPRPA